MQFLGRKPLRVLDHRPEENLFAAETRVLNLEDYHEEQIFVVDG